MPTIKTTPGEIWDRAKVIYDRDIRATVETDSNRGKVIVVDVESGDFEIGQVPIELTRKLRGRRPNGLFCALRIGADSVYRVASPRRPSKH